MAFARIIRQNFHNHPEVATRYDIKEKYLLIGLACAADDFGKLWNSPENIKSVIFPTDNVSISWIQETVQKLINNRVLCIYQFEDVEYIHFPKWFEDGWFLKQRIDHPREYQHPDCPTCNTEEKKWDELRTSRTIKSNAMYDNAI